MKRLFPLYRFGWAFLLAWVFTIFYTHMIEGYTGASSAIVKQQGAVSELLFMGLPVFFSVLTLFIIVRSEKRLGSPIKSARMLWLAPLLTAASCPFLFIQGPSYEITLVLFCIGALFTGVGSGLMWVMWGEYYAKISQDDTEYLAPISAVVAGVLVLLVSAMSGWLALVLVMCFPLISGFCLYLSWRDVGQHKASAEYFGATEQEGYSSNQAALLVRPWSALKLMGKAGLGIMIACLFVCLLGSFWMQTAEDLVAFQIVIIASIVFSAVVAVLSAKGPQRISISFLFRWMCPFLVLGFVAIIIWGGSWGGYAAYLISIAARFSFCLITQMFFARYVSTGHTTAVQAYGYGWIFVHLGDFLGVLSILVLNPLLALAVIEPFEVAAISIAVLTILTMLVMSRGDHSSVSALDRPFANPQNREFDKELRAGAKNSSIQEEKGAGTSSPVGSSAAQLENQIRVLAKEYKLTPREVEVFELLARGRSVPFIRDSLVISRDTAATHVKHIYSKLGVHSRQELIDLVQG